MATHQELTLSTFILFPIPPVPSLHQYCSDNSAPFPSTSQPSVTTAPQSNSQTSASNSAMQPGYIAGITFGVFLAISG
jgi:hypothetical protein